MMDVEARFNDGCRDAMDIETRFNDGFRDTIQLWL
jgi:hypothetical protein